MDLRSLFLSSVVRGRMSFRRREGVVRSLPVRISIGLWGKSDILRGGKGK